MGVHQPLHNAVVKASVATVAHNTKMICNDTCCTSSTSITVCWADHNYTQYSNLTYPEPWELGLRWTYTILVTLVAVLGNLCIIIILLKNRLLLRTSVNLFILNMSVADLITGVAGPIPFTIRETHNFWVLGEVWCHLDGFIQILVMLVSVTSLATISFDRMIGVVRPFHQHLKRWQSKGIIFLNWAVSTVLAVPFGLYRVYTVKVWQDMTEITCGEDEKIDVWWIVVIIGLNWLPLLVMVVSYITIFIYLNRNKSFNNRKEHPALIHTKKRVVRMMFVVVMVFAVCWIPFQFVKLGNKWFLNGERLTEEAEKTYSNLLTVSQYMIYLNTALNPIIYAFMHLTFRRAFKVTFPCFFNRESSFVLTPSQGMQRYVWSVKASASSVYGHDVINSPRRKHNDRLKEANQLTPSALLATSALAASIALEPRKNDSKVKENTPEGSGLGGSQGRYHRTGSVAQFPKELSAKSLVNENYVADLPHRKMSVLSTGSLGQLITQVIEEESSSDVENERYL